jgi:hypothetical protein
MVAIAVNTVDVTGNGVTVPLTAFRNIAGMALKVAVGVIGTANVRYLSSSFPTAAIQLQHFEKPFG